MKYIYTKLVIISLLFGIGYPKDSAIPIGNKNRQIGLFQPYILGFENVEISTHPILFLVKPNLRIKKYYGSKNAFDIATRFSFDYPTPFLKLIQRDGILGILSTDPNIEEIANLFIFQSELLVTKQISNFEFTNKIGLSICPSCELDKRNIVDFPISYPRMLLYQKGNLSSIGFDLDYFYSKKMRISTDLDLLILPDENIFIEHKLLFNYHLSNKISLSSGYKLSYGSYPYGSQIDLFPLFDILYFWENL